MCGTVRVLVLKLGYALELAIKKLMVPGPLLQRLRSNWSGVWLGHWDF